MARIVKREIPGGARPKYPWDVWFDGQVYELRRGGDFEMDLYSFRSYVYSRAAARGIRVRTHRVDEDTLVIQAVR